MVGASTPILLAGLGELVVEKSGVLNLGVEGMMLVGAVVGFAVTYTTGNPWLRHRLRGAGGGGGLDDLCGADTVALGQPGGDRAGADDFRHRLFGADRPGLYRQADRPVPLGLSGRAGATIRCCGWCSAIRPLVYFSLVMVVAVWWFLSRTRAGLILRAVGENDISAHSIGYSVIGVRYAAVAFGGAMAGIGGAASRCC